MFQAEGEAWGVHHAAHAQQDAGHEAAVVQRVMADGERLALAAEQYLLVGEEPAQPHGVDGDTVDVGAAGTLQRGDRGVRLGALPASARAAAISWAVRVAVPLGASALFGWCSSMTSTDSK